MTTPDLKAAALAASLMFDFVIDPPDGKTRCIRWVNAGCRPAVETEIAMWDALIERLQVAEDAANELQRVGGVMANVMFNLEQTPGRMLDDSNCVVMHDLRIQWDAARRLTP